MSVTFVGYILTNDTYRFPDGVSNRMQDTLGCPANMDPVEWINSDIEDQPNPLYDQRLDVNVSESNATEIFGILGLEKDGNPIPIEQFINIVAHHRQKRLGKASTAIAPTVIQGIDPNSIHGVLLAMTGRRAGYIEDILERLSTLAQAFKEYGAEYVGWG